MNRDVQCPFIHSGPCCRRRCELVLAHLSPTGGNPGHRSCKRSHPGRGGGEHSESGVGELEGSTFMILRFTRLYMMYGIRGVKVLLYINYGAWSIHLC